MGDRDGEFGRSIWKLGGWPVIDPHPKFSKVINNYEALDYIGPAIPISVMISYGPALLHQMKKIPYLQYIGIANTKLEALQFAITISTLSIPYIYSLARLKGYLWNDEEVVKYNVEATMEPRPYPVVEPLPKFTSVVGNFGLFDYSVIAAPPSVIGYYFTQGMLSKYHTKCLAVPAGITGFYLAYLISAYRLKGYFPNHTEVARYKYKE